MWFKCYYWFLYNLYYNIFTCVYCPVGDFIILAIFDLPSNVDNPIVSVDLFIAIDWIWLYLPINKIKNIPRSLDYSIVLFDGLFISIRPIF